jgi:PelA/Pel-15E family pectate lyase
MWPKARGFQAAIVIVSLTMLAPVCGQTIRTVPWDDVLEQPADFYATAQARRIADSVLTYQRESGGWPKDLDMTRADQAGAPARADATIDNGATTTQIRLLALVAAATDVRSAVADGRPHSATTYRTAALRGIDYLLQAQYPNGGWPQFFPLRKDYSRYITFNDNAMVNVLVLLDELARGTAPFDYVDPARRDRAADAVRRGEAVILSSQITRGGTLTAWCAQHDEVTLEPRPARSFEHASLSGNESVGIVRFLMTREARPEIIRAVDAAVAWLQRSRLPDGRWARFYELDTNRPIFSGRDGIVRYSVDEIEQERRDGYAWFGTWPRNLVEKQYPAWKARVTKQ